MTAAAANTEGIEAMSVVHELRTQIGVALQALYEGSPLRAQIVLEQAQEGDGLDRTASLMRFEDRLSAFTNQVNRAAKELRLVATSVVVTGRGQTENQFTFAFSGDANLAKLIGALLSDEEPSETPAPQESPAINDAAEPIPENPDAPA